MVMVAQGWVLLGILGVFAATVVTLMVYSQQSLRGYLEARFDTVDAKFDVLDRDVQSLIDRVFRDR